MKQPSAASVSLAPTSLALRTNLRKSIRLAARLLPSEGAHPQDQTRNAQLQSSDRLRQNGVAVFVIVSHNPAGRTKAPTLCQAKVQDVEKVRCARRNHHKTSSFKASGSTARESRERGGACSGCWVWAQWEQAKWKGTDFFCRRSELTQAQSCNEYSFFVEALGFMREACMHATPCGRLGIEFA